MHSLIRIITITFFIGFTEAVAASSNAMECVRKQLMRLEIELDIDQPETGFNQLQLHLDEDRFVFSNLNTISAPIICRSLGLKFPLLRLDWPSFRSPVNYSIEPSINAASIDTLTDLVLSRLKKEYGVLLAFPINLVVGSEREFLKEKWVELNHISNSNGAASAAFENAFPMSCPKNKKVGGFANSNTVLICLPYKGLKTTLPDQSSTTEERKEFGNLQGTLTHELFHAAQFQMLSPHPPQTPEERLTLWGPEWLFEGSAQYIGLSSVHTRESFERILKSSLETKELPSSYHLIYQDGKKMKMATSQSGLTRIEPLIASVGRSSLIDFYISLGQSRDWRTSFEASFETSYEAFLLNIAE